MSEASLRANLKLSTAYMAMARLEGLGLVENFKQGRARMLALTSIGQIQAEV